MQRGASGVALRTVNRSAVLRLIGHHGPISRAEIAHRLGVSPGTVTALTRTLIESGVVQPLTMASSRGGRPAEMLGMIGSAAVAVGAKVAADHIAVVQADLDGTILSNVTVTFDAAQANPFPLLLDVLEPQVRAAQSGHVLLGVGLGLPGFEDPYGTGTVQAPLFGWRHMPVGEHLSRSLGVPVLVDNDVNTLAVAESLYGVGRGFDHFLTVTIGRGVGMGIVIDGQLHRGGRGAAGELGHVCMQRDGALCACGKRGCLETIVAEPALVATAIRLGYLAAGSGPEDLAAAADGAHAGAVELYVTAGRTLGEAVAAASVIINPQALVIGGEGTRAWHHMADSFRDAYEANVFPPMRGATALHVEPWDDSKWALGAASLVLQAPFHTPLHDHPTLELIRGRLDMTATTALSTTAR